MVRETLLAARHRPDGGYFVRDWRPDTPPPAVTHLRSPGMEPYAVEGMVAVSIIVGSFIVAFTACVIGVLSWFDRRKE